MFPRWSVPFAVHTLSRNAPRLGTLLAIALLTFGCGHKRMSMRPMLLNRAPTVIQQPCSAPGGCGASPCSTPGGCGSAGPVVTDEVAPTPLPGGSAISPSASPGFQDEPMLSPAPSPVPAPGNSSSKRTNDGRIDRSSGEEPALNPQSRAPDATGLNRSNLSPPIPPAADDADSPRLESPSASNSHRNGRAALLVRSARGDSMSKLTRYVNDPQDLFDPPKADRAWQYIVVHHSAHASGSYAQIDRDHRERLGTHGCGYHFVIGNGTESPDGQIEVASRWSNQMAGAHCRDADASEINEYGIGICLIGNLDGTPPTDRQIEALQSLVDYLKNRYGISESRVGTHAQFASAKTACPGHLFPKDALRKPTARQPVASLHTRWLER